MWRRLAEMLSCRPAPLNDERSTKANELVVLGRETRQTSDRIKAISNEARLDGYRRIRVGR